MDTRTALAQLGVTAESMNAAQRTELDEQGFFTMENFFTPEQCALMASEVDRISQAEGDRAGSEVSIEKGALRVSNIFNKSTAFDCVLACKPLLAAAHHMLGEFKIHGSNVREPVQGQGMQPVHCDSHLMPDGRWCMINALILLDDMTLENGPTRIIPGSHKWPAYNVPGENNAGYGVREKREKPVQWATPDSNIKDHIILLDEEIVSDKFPEDPFAAYPGEVRVTVKSGTVVVCNAHMWHSGTTKNDSTRRRQLHLTYTCRDAMQQLNQQAYLTPGLFARLDEAQRFIFDVK